MSRRRFLRQTSTVALAGMLHDVLARGTDPQLQGMRKLSGDVRVNGKPASEGMLVLPGDTVTTGAGATAIYVIGRDAYLQRAGSSISFAKDALRVISGKLLSVFGKGDKQITVPTATIGIRGTGCYIETGAEGGKERTYFCLCYGTADITPSAVPSYTASITTHHHDKPQWIYADPAMPTGMADAKVINHTDAELEMLEALVGRVPPFMSGDYTPHRY